MHYQQNHERPFLTLADSDLNHDHYSLLERLERYIYLGDDRQITHRFCRGREIAEPNLYNADNCLTEPV